MQRVQRRPCALYLVSPVLTTYIIIVQYKKKEIDIWYNPQNIFRFHEFYNAPICVCVCVCGSMQGYLCIDL